MDDSKLTRGANIVVRHWVRLKPWESLLIVTSNNYMREALALSHSAQKRSLKVNLMIVEDVGKNVGIYFDKNEDAFDGYSAIIAATEYSLVTTLAAKARRGKKFLSRPFLPAIICPCWNSIFCIWTPKSRLMSEIIMKYNEHSTTIHVETPLIQI